MPTLPKTMPSSMMTFFLSEVSLCLGEFILVASSVWAEIFVDKIYKTSPSIHHCTIQCLNLFFPSICRLHLEPKGNMSQVGYIQITATSNFPIWMSNLSCTLFVVLCGTSAVEGWIDADFDCGNEQNRLLLQDVDSRLSQQETCSLIILLVNTNSCGLFVFTTCAYFLPLECVST